MKTKLILRLGIATVALAGAMLLIAAINEPPHRAATQAFMRQKLIYSQGVLEGLALEKFDLVSKNAIRLRNMTHSNLWYRMKQPDYMMHSTNYQRSAEAVYKAAIEKDLDRATEAYAVLAKNCVDCHRVVRLQQHQQEALRTK